MRIFILFVYLSRWLSFVYGKGLLILYRPQDITNECAFSQYLRYDLTFGGGLSDTLTLVFRTMNEYNYECVVEISVDKEEAHIIMVIRYPNTVIANCLQNWDSFAVLKKDKCIRICDVLGGRDDLNTPYFITESRGRFRFRFASNSSINADMNALLYQVTATTARKTPPKIATCLNKNETVCEVNGEYYCYTSGVVCDGIKNCGVADWFDERLGDCEFHKETLGFGPLLAVLSVMICVVMAGGHILFRCLPPLASSFFIFNANEDNRLCIDSVYKVTERTSFEVEKNLNNSLIPISLRSSSEEEVNVDKELKLQDLSKARVIPVTNRPTSKIEISSTPLRRGTLKSMTARLHQTLRTAIKSKPTIRSSLSNHIDVEKVIQDSKL